ncbi:MAG: DUF1576 domain-containing protein [Oscillospiraceae bacterium]|nr:DUF1576 domain-containing protein [Oscillospiraceae bacterium]
MEEMAKKRFNIPFPYALMLSINIGFLAIAFILDSPAYIFEGFLRIITSRVILITDFVAVGGIGATFVNAGVVGILSIVMLLRGDAKPSGATIMALWVTAGFAFFGKNVYNMIPLTVGVWLFSRYKKEPYTNYSLASLLVATLSPVVSDFSFLGVLPLPIEMTIGIVLGVAIGFIFPAVSAHMVRMHSGYDLYSMGFAGGLISMILSTSLRSMGRDIESVSVYSTGNNLPLAIILFFVSAVLICGGLFSEGGPKANFEKYKKFHSHTGRLITDFYFLYKNSIYINMGILCAFATAVTLAIGAELNGISIAGIFTMVGFACFGKHMKNVVPILIGAVLSAYLNVWDFTTPANVAAILFAAALAPLAGQFGWIWGIIAGFLHVSVAMHVGELSGGMNLYNNGFAAGFIAMILLPIITISERMRKNHED